MATYILRSFEPKIGGQLAVEFDQKLNAIRYKSQSFILSASIDISITDSSTYEIGLIQVVNKNLQLDYYTSGATQRWELVGAGLDKDGYNVKPVNDSDIDKNIPWYNINPARTIVNGPATKTVNVTMNDSFIPLIPWTEAAVGVPNSNLTRIVRAQSFDVWLVSRSNAFAGNVVLADVEWQVPVDIVFQPVLNADGPPIYKPSSWINNAPSASFSRPDPSKRLPGEAFEPPRANYSMALYRYPADGSSKRFIGWADGRKDPPPV